jgi:hypothetical protein
MAKRIFQVTGNTFTATSDSTIPANFTYMALSGATASQRIDVLEVYWGGLASASAPHALQLCRTITPGTTTSALTTAINASDGPEDSATAALLSPPWAYMNCATNPIPPNSITDARLNLAGNAFGGIVRWNAAPTQQWTITGNTSPAVSMMRCSNLAAATSPVLSAHIIYEPY